MLTLNPEYCLSLSYFLLAPFCTFRGPVAHYFLSARNASSIDLASDALINILNITCIEYVHSTSDQHRVTLAFNVFALLDVSLSARSCKYVGTLVRLMSSIFKSPGRRQRTLHDCKAEQIDVCCMCVRDNRIECRTSSF